MRQNWINSIGDIKQELNKKIFNSDKKEGSINIPLLSKLYIMHKKFKDLKIQKIDWKKKLTIIIKISHI